MLERKDNDVFDSFERRRAMGTGKTLCENDLNSAVRITSIPVPLFQDVWMEWREAQDVLIAVSIHFCLPLLEEE
jgi:hypothetical protein